VDKLDFGLISVGHSTRHGPHSPFTFFDLLFYLPLVAVLELAIFKIPLYSFTHDRVIYIRSLFFYLGWFFWILITRKLHRIGVLECFVLEIFLHCIALVFFFCVYLRSALIDRYQLVIIW
jgi:hypothetical protein